MAMARCGRLRAIFDSNVITMKSKLRLYEAATCSLMTYGCETRNIDENTRKRINGTNSIMLARITGKSVPSSSRSALDLNESRLNQKNKDVLTQVVGAGAYFKAGSGKYCFSDIEGTITNECGR